MGYTNYWHQHDNISNEDWKLIKNEYHNYVQEIAGDKIVDSSTEDTISFDGGYEPFVFSRYAKTKPDYAGQDSSLHYCKTKQCLYDIFVWYLLVYINRICPNVSISRDM
jgi:hypothetical protein|tara:strand:+ start:522 stop:848 length:327 start_codon:yes stop_codon:yes gene_type:complete